MASTDGILHRQDTDAVERAKSSSQQGSYYPSPSTERTRRKLAPSAAFVSSEPMTLLLSSAYAYPPTPLALYLASVAYRLYYWTLSGQETPTTTDDTRSRRGERGYFFNVGQCNGDRRNRHVATHSYIFLFGRSCGYYEEWGHGQVIRCHFPQLTSVLHLLRLPPTTPCPPCDNIQTNLSYNNLS